MIVKVEDTDLPGGRPRAEGARMPIFTPDAVQEFLTALKETEEGVGEAEEKCSAGRSAQATNDGGTGRNKNGAETDTRGGGR